MKTCKYIRPGAENVAPRSAKAARKLIGKPVVFACNWDITPSVVLNRFGVVEDAYFDNIKISGVWSRFASVFEMS